MKCLLSILTLLFLSCCCISARQMVYNVGPFDSLNQKGNVNIVYRNVPDSVGLACYYSDTDYSDALDVTSRDGKLTIKEVSRHNLGKLPTIYVYSDYLTQVKSEGNATVEVELNAVTPTFSATLVGNGRIICNAVNTQKASASINTGNGTIVMRGECENADFKLTGTGVIQADELEAIMVKCMCLGTGSIGCNPLKTLDVRGIGTTKIYYLGNPEIKKVGGAHLSPINKE